MKTSYLVTLLIIVLVSACSSHQKAPGAAAAQAAADADLVARAQAPLLEGLGNFHHPITTRDPGAQRYFDQGMVMASGFNHAEAIRAFQAAQAL